MPPHWVHGWIHVKGSKARCGAHVGVDDGHPGSKVLVSEAHLLASLLRGSEIAECMRVYLTSLKACMALSSLY
jgi:hypothetical protein